METRSSTTCGVTTGARGLHRRSVATQAEPIAARDSVCRSALHCGSLETRPAFVLILTWDIQDEVIGQLTDIQSWGGRFVVPVPRLMVLPATVTISVRQPRDQPRGRSGDRAELDVAEAEPFPALLEKLAASLDAADEDGWRCLDSLPLKPRTRRSRSPACGPPPISSP